VTGQREQTDPTALEFWYPVRQHMGAGGSPWFAIDHDGLVRRFVGHPMGASAVPSFYVVDAVAYTTGEDETRFCAPGVPWFDIIGWVISPGEGHPDRHTRITLYEQRDDFMLSVVEPVPATTLMSREEDLLAACVEFADTGGDTYDIIESAQRLADRCVELVDTSEAGVMLSDRDGTLCCIASSSEPTRVIELYEIEHHEGPSLDAFESGLSAHRSMSDGANNWPEFATRAREAGFASVSVLPLRLRAQTIGTLSLYSAAPEPLDSNKQSVAQALADIATIGILQQRALGDGRDAVSQLEHALESRVLIEQAKGILSERLALSIDAAFALLRSYARAHNRTLRRTATDIITKAVGVDEITLAVPALIVLSDG
jgi:ANTAR domain/GAF domain